VPEIRSIRWPLVLVFAGLIGVPAGSILYRTAHAASDELPPPVKMTKEEDHQHMMDLLHITELRRGRNGTGDQKDPNFANYDESKANPFPDLPDPLTLKNGKKVTKASDWWTKRRPEIVEDFDREVYGRVPKVTPQVKWEVTSTSPGKNGEVDIVTKQLVGVVDNSSYPYIEVKMALTLVTPADAKGPVPVVMQLGSLAGFGAGRGTPERPGLRLHQFRQGRLTHPMPFRSLPGAGVDQRSHLPRAAPLAPLTPLAPRRAKVVFRMADAPRQRRHGRNRFSPEAGAMPS
jgi:hypothetical protein